MTADAQTRPRSTDAVRLLAAAAGAARLYPPASALPREAVERFVDGIVDLDTPLRIIVEPNGFREGDQPLPSQAHQLHALAEQLYALQIGQLVIAPGVTIDEASAFVEIANADPAAVRANGGARAELNARGCQHIAAIELSVRQIDEATLADLDLTSAPLEDIAASLPAATKRWVESARAGSGEDEVEGAVSSLERATHDVATERIAEAVMRLDEKSRALVMENAMKADRTGRRMEGMLKVFAKMRPAALARLLMLTAANTGEAPGALAATMELPPETLQLLERLLGPTPEPAEEADAPEATEVAAEMVPNADEPAHLESLVRGASLELASGRALSTAVAVSRTRPSEENVRAIADALPGAAKVGAFQEIRRAVRRLDELREEAALTGVVDDAAAALARPDVLRQVCLTPRTDADAAIAGELLADAGPAGAEALLESYHRADPDTRALLRPVLRSLSQPLLGIAARRIRTDDADAACGVLRMLPKLGDSRAVPTMQQALAHLDPTVRRTALLALAESRSPEARTALTKAIGHWDPTTQRHAVREIGRVKATEAIPAMSRILEDINPFERSHELKREIILSMEAIGSPEALPVLRRVAGRRVAVGRKPKELRIFAQRAITSLERTQALPDQGAE